ncbi:MAG: hypothetical protein ACRDJC_22740, partial [Thermomicrobiales bacterium]
MESSSGLPAHDPTHMRGVLQQYLQPVDGGTSYRVRECHVANTRRRDGSRGTVEYNLCLEDPATGQLWDQKVTGISYGGERTRRVWESMQRALTPQSPAPAEMLPPFAYVPELDLLLQVFPHDHRLPALARLLAGPSPELWSSLLVELGVGDWTLRDWHAEVVQYRVDMRAILRLSVRASASADGAIAERVFYAKIYRDPGQGQRAFHAQRDLHERAIIADGPLRVARPIVYLAGWRTLVTASAPGVSLSRIIRRGDDVAPAVRSAAAAIAAFHQLDAAAASGSAPEDIARLREAESF